MKKIEELLRIASDSSRMPGWNDSLSYIVSRNDSGIKALSDEELDMVAGGVSIEEPDTGKCPK